MFKVDSLALAAALSGVLSSTFVSAQSGCFPSYIAGAPYVAGNWVSNDVTEDVDGTSVTKTYNFQCRDGPSAQFCANSGFAPGGLYSDSAWDQGAECAGDQTLTPTTSPNPPSAWASGGCPGAYVAGSSYSPGDVASVDMGSYFMVYECNDAPLNEFCGQQGYEPGASANFEIAWTALGSCEGTITPTTAPQFDPSNFAGGCPGEYAAGTSYEEGDRVSSGSFVFECMAYPASAHCGQDGYAPLDDSATPDAWKDAWELVGYCEGTITPTTSPISTLPDVGGCPDEWAQGANLYEEGDQVSVNGLVFTCGVFPASSHCGQAGYMPLTEGSEAWKDVWTVTGTCDGTITPTTSPIIDVASPTYGGCPEAWVKGDNTSYEEGDLVSVVVSTEPLRKVAFSCKGWPESGHCGQYSPDEDGGDLGWEVVGACDGTITPTASPSFTDLTVDSSGCPVAYDSAETGYEAGDRVSVTVSETPERKIVFECRTFPNDGYCNQAGFEPAFSANWESAWTIIGACSGTITPTDAPIAYAGSCQYDKCVIQTSTSPNCVPGSAGCSCLAGYPASADCVATIETEVCTPTDVDPYAESTDYVTDDVIRVGTLRYKCREWPNYLWCRNDAYKPTGEATGIWTDAWTADGECS